MTDTQKKTAAAIAAVMHYLRREEESAVLPAAAPAPPQPALPAGPTLWALNGRQTQMQLRNLMQLRAIGRMG